MKTSSLRQTSFLLSLDAWPAPDGCHQAQAWKAHGVFGGALPLAGGRMLIAVVFAALAQHCLHVQRSLCAGHQWASTHTVPPGCPVGLLLILPAPAVWCCSCSLYLLTTSSWGQQPSNLHFFLESFIHVRLLFVIHWSSLLSRRVTEPLCCVVPSVQSFVLGLWLLPPT